MLGDVRDEFIDTLVAITSTLVEDADPAAVLRLTTTAAADLLDATAGVLVTDPRGGLRVIAASDERAAFVELLQLRGDRGPGVECVRTKDVVAADLHDSGDRWPEFTAAATESGFRAVQALPLRLDGQRVGAFLLLHPTSLAMTRPKRNLGQALADLITLALCESRDNHRTERLAQQTLAMLNDRVALDHAIGYVAGALDVSVDKARAVIEEYARQERVPASTLARTLVDGRLNPADLAG